MIGQTIQSADTTLFKNEDRVCHRHGDFTCTHVHTWGHDALMKPEMKDMPRCHCAGPPKNYQYSLWNGLLCSAFDIATFLYLRFYYRVYKLQDSAFFQSAWFVEDLLMQSIIIHMIRTEKIPFEQDVASGPVIFSTIMVPYIATVTPFTFIGKARGLVGLPFSYFGFLVILVLAYFSVRQAVKRTYIFLYKKWL